MRKLFKASLLIVALLAVIGLNAQEKATTFGIKGGLNLSNMSGDGQTADSKIGFNVGVTLDQLLAKDLYLLTGLEYSLKGAKGGGGTLNLSYLQLPIHMGYKLVVADNTKLVFRAGPYIGYAIDGTFKAGGVSIDLFSDEFKGLVGFDVLNRFDAGLGLGLGMEFGQIGVNLGYDFGLANIEKSGGTTKNQNAYLSLGYRF